MPLVGFSRYELQERIGIGGMAEVFRARAFDASGESREVVVKKILPHHNEEADFRTMFMDEARIAANLDHPNVVRVLDLGRLDGDLFLAMEFVEGTDLLRLSEWIERANRKMPVATALHLGAEILKGLHHAHTRADAAGRSLGIVHRDVTPQNVLVSVQGAVKLTDFGIARAANRLSHTMVGTMKGNLLYSSPEQISGTPVDARADVYSAGILLYRLLAGRHPFDGDDLPKIYQRTLSGDIPPVSTMNTAVPTNLDRIVARATARVPDQRFASADELRRALEDFLAGKQLSADMKALCSDVRAMKSGLRPALKLDGRILVPEAEAGNDVQPTNVGAPRTLTEDAPAPRLSNLPLRPIPEEPEEKTQTMPMQAMPPHVDEEEKTSRTFLPPRPAPAPAGDAPARVASTILLPASQATPDAAATMVMGLPPLDEPTPVASELSRAVAEVLEEPSGPVAVPSTAVPDVSSSLSPAVLAALADSAWPEAPPSLPDRTVEIPQAPPPTPAPEPAPIAAEPPSPPAPLLAPPAPVRPAPPPQELSEVPPPIVSAPGTAPRRTTLPPGPAPLPPWELPRKPTTTPAPGRPLPTPPPWSTEPRVVDLDKEPPRQSSARSSPKRRRPLPRLRLPFDPCRRRRHGSRIRGAPPHRCFPRTGPRRRRALPLPHRRRWHRRLPSPRIHPPPPRRHRRRRARS